jgi:hypothetical protein
LLLARIAPCRAQAASWLVARVILCESPTMGNLGGWSARRRGLARIIQIQGEVR